MAVHWAQMEGTARARTVANLESVRLTIYAIVFGLGGNFEGCLKASILLLYISCNVRLLAQAMPRTEWLALVMATVWRPKQATYSIA